MLLAHLHRSHNLARSLVRVGRQTASLLLCLDLLTLLPVLNRGWSLRSDLRNISSISVLLFLFCLEVEKQLFLLKELIWWNALGRIQSSCFRFAPQSSLSQGPQAAFPVQQASNILSGFIFTDQSLSLRRCFAKSGPLYQNYSSFMLFVSGKTCFLSCCYLALVTFYHIPTLQPITCLYIMKAQMQTGSISFLCGSPASCSQGT